MPRGEGAISDYDGESVFHSTGGLCAYLDPDSLDVAERSVL